MDAYDAVVFDMDGVLLTPTDGTIIRRAARATVEGFDLEPADRAAVVSALADATLDRLADRCEPYGLDPETLWRGRERAAARLQAAEMAAGRKRPYDDVRVLARLDAALGVVSNNQHRTVEHALSRFGLDRVFPVARGRTDTMDGARRRKPDPHYLDRTLSELGVGPEAALYVGDSRVDVEAARRAGADSAFLRRAHRLEYDLDAEPTHEIRGLDDLLAG